MYCFNALPKLRGKLAKNKKGNEGKRLKKKLLVVNRTTGGVSLINYTKVYFFSFVYDLVSVTSFRYVMFSSLRGCDVGCWLLRNYFTVFSYFFFIYPYVWAHNGSNVSEKKYW